MTLFMLSTVIQDICSFQGSHKHAFKQGGCHLKAHSDKRLIMKPSEKLLKIDSFPGVNFTGIYQHKATNDVFWVKTEPDTQILLSIVIMQQCKLQCKTTLTTMNAEIIALSQSWNELFSIMDEVSIVGHSCLQYHNSSFNPQSLH